MMLKTSIGNYHLLRLLGSGGFSEVYLGQHNYLKTNAAIKVLNTASNYSRDDLKRFVQEARTIAQLRHPHIVSIFDFNVENGIPYLVMEYAPNGSLASRHQVKAGVGIAPPVVLSFVKQVASALQFAHDQRVVHCDIKPENMLLNAQNEVLLSDFGIAVVLHSSLRTQQALGTMHYMAPEQFVGKPVPASDQYALAVVAYRWLTGRFPLKGKTVEEIYRQHAGVTPRSLRDLDPQIPSAADRVVLKALAKEPGRRFISIAAFALALEEAITDGATSAASRAAIKPDAQSFPARQNEPQTLLPSLFSLLPSAQPEQEQEQAANFLYAPTHIQQPAVRAHSAELPGQALSGDDTVMINKSLSVPSTSTDLVYRQHVGWVTTLAWSPDGARIASGSWDTTVHVWDAANGATLLTYREHKQPVKSVSWSPSGGHVASGSWDGTVRVWDVVTGETLLPEQYHHDAQVEAVAWSPDGRLIASGGADGRIRIWGAFNKRTIFTYTGHMEQIAALCWSPDGRYIASAGYDQTVQVWEAQTGQQVSVYEKHDSPVTAVTWSGDGCWIASADEKGKLHLWSMANDTAPRHYQGDAGAVKSLCWSPDSRFIAASAQCVYIWNVEGPSEATPTITYNAHTDWINALVWSPDGQKIASASDDGTVRVWDASNKKN